MVITSCIPAEKISRAVEHPCQFWIGTRPFRLSVFGRRQHPEVFERLRTAWEQWNAQFLPITDEVVTHGLSPDIQADRYVPDLSQRGM